jgi:hypothetical protein
MPNFANGKIYAIRSHQTEQIYVGSTTQTLAQRFAKHRRILNTMSKEIIKFEDCYIELLENYPCADKNELNRREGHFIRTMNCVNKNIAGRTYAEYYVDNKEHRTEQAKYYYQNNKEQAKQRMKQYREEHKEQIKQHKNQKHNCCCGGRYANGVKSEHFKTAKHREFVNQFHNRLHTLLHA